MVKSNIFLLLAACFVFAQSSPAQLEKLLQGKEATPAPPAETIVEIRARIEDWDKENTATLEQLDSVGPGSGLPEGITKEDYTARIRYHNAIRLAANRHLSVLSAAPDAEKELAEAERNAREWKGFDADPPYSILLLDGLLSKKTGLEEKILSRKSSLDVFSNMLGVLLKQSNQAAEETSQAITLAEQASDVDRAAAQWRVDTAKAKQLSLFLRASSLKYDIASVEKFLRAAEIDLGLVNRQLETASKDFKFREDDLEKIQSASNDRQADYTKREEETSNRLILASREKQRFEKELEALRTGGTASAEALELAELRLEVATSEVEALQTMVEAYEFYAQLETLTPEAYEFRRTLMNSEDRAERKRAFEGLSALVQRLKAGETIAKNELDATTTDLNEEESRASALSAGDPGLILLNRQRDILREKRDLIQQVYLSTSSQAATVARWISDFEVKESAPWYSPVTSGVDRLWSAIVRAWNIPVTSYEETSEQDGMKVTNTRYVRLGTVVSAIALFVLAYFIAAKISRRLQRELVSRRLIEDAQARTLRNWIMLVVAMLLALATLSWLSIPLTIFAFLAGALAIGVGFGTQTMIKNFISGIILLFERKVRVGDIIEVDGTLGVVSEINTRSSIVRGFNGIENLIPNSLFLENKVVNWTLNSSFLRRELELGVAYGTSPQKVIEILNEAADRHGLILKDPAPFSVFETFADNSLNFRLYYWVELNDKTNSLIVGSDLRIMIEKKLAEAGIGVPFPQRDIHLNTGTPMQVELTRRRPEQHAEEKPKPAPLP